MILNINDNPTVWELKDSENKIDNTPIFDNLKSIEDNINDFYSFYNIDSDVLHGEKALKEEYINQIAYPVYNINAETFDRLNTEVYYYKRRNDLHNVGNISGAQLCVVKAGYTDYKELEESYNKNIDMYNDINAKYIAFINKLNQSKLLTIDSSIKARTNESNRLSDNNYTNSITEHCNLLSEKAENANSECDELTETLNNTNTQFDELALEKTNISNKITSLNNTIVTKLAEKEDSTKQYKTLVASNELLIDKLNNLKTQSDDKNRLYQSYIQTIDGLNAYKININTCISYIEEMLQTENYNQNDKISFIENTYNSIIENISDNQIINISSIIITYLNNFSIKLDDENITDANTYLHLALDKINESINLFNAKIANTDSSLNVISTKLTLLEEEIKELNENKITSDNKLNEALEYLNSINETIENTKTSLNKYTNDLKEINNRLNEKSNEISNIEISLNNKKKLCDYYTRLFEVLSNLKEKMTEKQRIATENKEKTSNEIKYAKQLRDLNQELYDKLDELAKDPNRSETAVNDLINEYYNKSVYRDMLKLDTIRIYI